MLVAPAFPVIETVFDKNLHFVPHRFDIQAVSFYQTMSDPTIIDSGESAFQKKPELNSHLAWESFIALAKHPNRVLVIDRTLKRRELKSGLLLALAWNVSRKLQAWTDRNRVGIVFPPGIGACIANLAVVLAGKVPVNLNFTLGRTSAEAHLR